MNCKQNPLPINVQYLLWFFISITSLFLISATSVLAGSDADRQKNNQVVAMYDEYTKSFPGVKDIAIKDALLLLANDEVVFVDVRKAKEQKVSMIPGAVTKEHFMENLEQYREKKIIAYCTISYRSGKFAEKMEKRGIGITNLQAGLLGWVHAHGPLVDKNGAVSTLNVYGRAWDLAPSWITTVY
jgi:rhodanese-related sulfurtransferase